MKKIGLFALWVVLVSSGPLPATTIDFSQDEDGTPFVNGQDIMSPDEFGNRVSLSVGPTNFAAAIFDSDPVGPNATEPFHQDLIINQGNILIIQDENFPTQTVPGVFDQPFDSTTGGTFHFDFANPSRMNSIDLIDIDENDSAEVILNDNSGKVRTYSIPQNWTFDLRVNPAGFDTLDLTTIMDQPGEAGGIATATENAGFDPKSVTRMTVNLFGSGAIDNLVFVPEPSVPCLGIILAIWIANRRRNSS